MSQPIATTPTPSATIAADLSPQSYLQAAKFLSGLDGDWARQIAAMLESGALCESLHVPQTPDTGVGAVIGKWPGAETDEDVADYFDCDPQTIRDADGRVVHRAGNDRTYIPGDDMPEM